MENSCKLDISSLKAHYNAGNYEQFINEYEGFKDTEAYMNLTKEDKDELDRLYQLAKAELDRKKGLEQKGVPTKLKLDDLNQYENDVQNSITMN